MAKLLRGRFYLAVAALGLLLAGGAFRLGYRPRPTRPAAASSGAPATAPAAAARPDDSGPIVLRDVLERTGIKFRHTDGSSGERYIVEAMTGGVAVFDFDGDGLSDIYFLNGRLLPGAAAAGPPPRNALYRNDGNWTFTDVTEAVGVDGGGFGMGVAVGDYNNDGFPDLFVNNFGPDVLYRNNGDGTFSDASREAGVAGSGAIGAGTNFLDIDGDGNLDLFVSNYVQFSFDKNPKVTVMGFAAYAGPYLFDKQPNNLYRNRGDGTFADVTAESGIGAHAGAGMGTVCADYDNDGDTDIFVNNDMSENFLFENDGHGKFQEVGLLRGVAFDVNGQAQSSMGVDAADYDHDGWLDFFCTSFASEMPALYRNLGNKTCADVTALAGAVRDTYPHVNWGAGFVDFDNDGWQDLHIVNGHLDENVHEYDQAAVYDAVDFVLRNTGDGKFANVSDRCGDGLQLRLSGRGSAFGDLDNDGRIDVVVLNSRREPTILRNDSPGGNHWLQVALRGVQCNRAAIGTRVRVVAGDLVQIDEVHSGRGYQSHWGMPLHFGLGPRERVDRLEVHWLGGGVDVLTNVRADQLITIVEGRTAADRDGGG
jgi:hypothetical protein